MYLRARPELWRRVASSPFPDTYPDLVRRTAPRSLSLKRELHWALAYLTQFSHDLREFATLSGTFDRAMLLGAYDDATRALDGISSRFGHSLWLIRHRLASIQAKDGLEAQKQLAQQIGLSSGHARLAAVVAFNTSVVNEPTVGPAAFRLSLAKQTAGSSAKVRTTLQYHVAPRPLYRDEIADVLSLESSGTIIDYYEAFVRSLLTLGASGSSDGLLAGQVAATLGAHTLDSRLISVAALHGHSSVPLSAAIAGHEALLRGDTQGARRVLTEVSWGSDAQSLLTAATFAAVAAAAPHIPVDTPLSKLVAAMEGFLTRRPGFEEDIARLDKYLMCFPSSRASTVVANLLSSSSPPSDYGAPAPYETLLGDCFDATLSLDSGDMSTRRLLARALQVAYPATLSARYSARAAGSSELGSDDLPLREEELARLDGDSCTRNGDFVSALRASAVLLSSEHRVYRVYGLRLRGRALLALGDIRALVSLCAHTVVTDGSLLSLLPLTETVALLNKDARRSLSDALALPILYDVYSKRYSRRHDDLRNYAFEDFLRANHLKRPSALRSRLTAFSRAELIYYLRYVCVESVMETSRYFRDSTMVTEERLAVCRLLTDLDQENADSYKSEISDLLRRLMVKRRMREIEQSKIYVDTASIRRALTSTLRERFQRYRAFLQSGLSESSFANVAAAIAPSPDGLEGEPLDASLPENEMRDLLVEMLSVIAKEYVSSPDHGLNAFLSVRVRHGTLVAHLRAPLERHHLVTQRGSAGYRANQYWKDRLDTNQDAGFALIDAHLASFSAAMDHLIQTIRGEWLQVGDIGKGKGLFTFGIRQTYLNALAIILASGATFEQFLDGAFTILQAELSDVLQTVRARLEDDAKPAAASLLNELQTKLESQAAVFEQIDVRPLIASIGAARTDLMRAFDRVKEWFQLAKTDAEREPFSLEDVIRLSEASIRIRDPLFAVDLSITSEEQVLFHASQLATLDDAFRNVFENIVEHAKSPAGPRAVVTASFTDNQLTVRVANAVGTGVAAARREHVERVRARLAGDSYRASVAREGGSGLAKVRRALGKATLVFGFEHDTDFVVHFTIPTRVLTSLNP